MLYKGFSGTKVQVKDEERGEVAVVFATMNVIDHDGHVTLPGAFGEQNVRISDWNHSSWGGARPVGKGTIRELGNEAIMEGQFFMDTEAGREAFRTVKGLGELQEWSYGFDVVEASQGEFEGEQVQFLKRLKVHEVSPVILGAGINTRTLTAKSRGEKFADHIERVRSEVVALTERATSLADLRAKDGRSLSDTSKERLEEVSAALARASEQLRSLLTEPKQHTPPLGDLADLDAELMALAARLRIRS